MIYLPAAIVTVLYALFILLLLWNWYKIPAVNKELQANDFASVLVPVRNESESIENLILSIQRGNIKSDNFELIVIDDHSTDGTIAVVESLQSHYDNLLLTILPDGQEGKKAAITHGVQMAKGDLIVCTDGDSEVHRDWLNVHRNAFEKGAKLSFGPVRLINLGKSRFIDLLNLELAGLVSMGGATLAAGQPTMINGCNYSFSKEVFEEVEGFRGNEKIATGDDEFLLRKIFKKYPKNIDFLKTKKALVNSRPPQNFLDFYNQRRRWASKWRFHKDVFSRLIPLFIFLSYALWGWVFIQSVVDGTFYGIMILGFKCLIDYCYLSIASQLQMRKVSLLNLGLLQIIYPFYVVFFGVASNFGKYSWRERAYKI
ncbi:glycosyltransferase [Reichenbachiella sp.]|uniref:glycosyltransferase n=1 Tax=Reichenbachiella sp. TaxID=2184521 RepID=UPI0032970B47